MSWRSRLAGHLGVRAPDRPLLRWLAGRGDPLRQVELLGEFGFGGVFDNFLVMRTPAEQAAIGEAAARCGLEMGSFVHDPLAWDRPTWSVAGEDARAALAEALGRSLETAARSGSRTINCVTGRAPDADERAQLGAMADNLRWAGDRAGEAGVTLCIEATHPTFAPGLLVERLGVALELLERIDHAQVRLNLDVGHLALHGDDIPAAIRAAAGRIGLVQLADVPGRVEPGAGTLDWPAIIRALEGTGYGGLLELELEPAANGAAGEQAMLERLGLFEDR